MNNNVALYVEINNCNMFNNLKGDKMSRCVVLKTSGQKTS